MKIIKNFANYEKLTDILNVCKKNRLSYKVMKNPETTQVFKNFKTLRNAITAQLVLFST